MSSTKHSVSFFQDQLGAAVSFTDDLNGAGPTKILAAPPINDDDLFDPARFRQAQGFQEADVPTLVLTVPVRKPSSQIFIRTHPDRAFQFEAPLLLVSED